MLILADLTQRRKPMSEHEKTSPSAWMTAQLRNYLCNIPYSAEIAQQLDQDQKPFLMNLLYKVMLFVARKKPHKISQLALIETRYRCIEEALPRDHDFVLIELGAGLSPRGLTHSKTGRLVIKSDLPDLIA